MPCESLKLTRCWLRGGSKLRRTEWPKTLVFYLFQKVFDKLIILTPFCCMHLRAKSTVIDSCKINRKICFILSTEGSALKLQYCPLSVCEDLSLALIILTGSNIDTTEQKQRDKTQFFSPSVSLIISSEAQTMFCCQTWACTLKYK